MSHDFFARAPEILPIYPAYAFCHLCNARHRLDALDISDEAIRVGISLVE